MRAEDPGEPLDMKAFLRAQARFPAAQQLRLALANIALSRGSYREAVWLLIFRNTVFGFAFSFSISDHVPL